MVVESLHRRDNDFYGTWKRRRKARKVYRKQVDRRVEGKRSYDWKDNEQGNFYANVHRGWLKKGSKRWDKKAR